MTLPVLCGAAAVSCIATDGMSGDERAARESSDVALRQIGVRRQSMGRGGKWR